MMHCTCGCGWVLDTKHTVDEFTRAGERAWRCEHKRSVMTHAGYKYCHECHHWLKVCYKPNWLGIRFKEIRKPRYMPEKLPSRTISITTIIT